MKFVDELQENRQILSITINELQIYMKLLNAQIIQYLAIGKLKNSKDIVVKDFFNHQEQLNFRIGFIRDLTKYGSFTMTSEHLQTLWI